MSDILPCVLLTLLVPCFFFHTLKKACASNAGWLLSLPAFAAFALLLALVPQIASGEAISYRIPWVPLMGIDFSLHLSPIRLILALLVTGIGGCIQLYSYGYMHHSDAPRLSTLLYVFMFAMVGVSLADHLILFFTFWEITSISSYLLIGFNHTEKSARRNALQALLVTSLGGISLLLACVLLATTTGIWHLSELPEYQTQIVDSPYYLGILILVLLGAFTKSAQFPFHFWLPNAMAAPTPVSAYLHSATMVKAGVFLLFLMTPILGGTEAWSYTLIITGSITFFLGGIFGFEQKDLKKILAGSTLAILGFIVLLIGLGTSKALLAALLVLLAHAFYKASLFMITGCVDHATGTRNIDQLGGLRKYMPITAIAATLSALSMAGAPPFLGFIGKEYALKSILGHPADTLLLAATLVCSTLIVALALKSVYQVFWTQPVFPNATPHECQKSMLIGPLLLSVLGLLSGIFPHSSSSLLILATNEVAPVNYTGDIHLWNGFNLPLLLSATAILAGIFFFKIQNSVTRLLQKAPSLVFDTLYQRILDGTIKIAARVTTLLQSGFLRHYIIIIILTTFVLIYQKLITFGTADITSSDLPWNLPVMLTIILMLGAALVAVISKSRLTTLLALGLVGYGVAFIFMQYSAPDLAITQILVETLTVVLFASVVHKLPNHKPLSSKKHKFYDLSLAIAFGTMITLLVLKSSNLTLSDSIANDISKISYPQGNGTNIVNVILVDFRALDTWGEICVLAIASLGAASVLNSGFRKNRRRK